jgi:hypothetical protein
MRRLLDRSPDLVLFIEIGTACLPDGCHPGHMLDLLFDLGFRLSWIDERSAERRPASRREQLLDLLQREPYVNVVAVRGGARDQPARVPQNVGRNSTAPR